MIMLTQRITNSLSLCAKQRVYKSSSPRTVACDCFQTISEDFSGSSCQRRRRFL